MLIFRQAIRGLGKCRNITENTAAHLRTPQVLQRVCGSLQTIVMVARAASTTDLSDQEVHTGWQYVYDKTVRVRIALFMREHVQWARCGDIGKCKCVRASGWLRRLCSTLGRRVTVFRDPSALQY